jgi:hydroxymethylbilane synthase
LLLLGLVVNRTGSKIIRAKRAGNPAQAENIGTRVAQELIDQGAEDILREFNE